MKHNIIRILIPAHAAVLIRVKYCESFTYSSCPSCCYRERIPKRSSGGDS